MGNVSALVIAEDDPAAPDVRELLARHLEFAHRHSPPEDVYALDSEALSRDDGVTFFSARLDGELAGVGALRRLDSAHAEIRSMRTSTSARGQGIGRAMPAHLLQLARERGFERVSSEPAP